MDVLLRKSKRKIQEASTSFVRYLSDEIDWTNRLIAIKGARGVGKTTLLLQHIKQNFRLSDVALYVSLDDIWFAENRLTGLVEHFVYYGGKYLFLDEVHKYPDWSKEIKNIYDDYSSLNIVFTGSSALQILKGDGDLSRRAVVYDLYGLSFREFLSLAVHLDFPVLTFDDIIDRYIDISADISSKIKPLKYFHEYLKTGYYPYFMENRPSYLRRLESTVNLILETDLPAILNIDFYSVVRLKKLLYAVSTSAPFKPNITELAGRIGTGRDTLLRYIHHLNDASLISLLIAKGKGISYLTKPEKIYLDNTNLYAALDDSEGEIGAVRETFLFNQLKVKNKVNWTSVGDFLVNDQITLEVGGRNKKYGQIAQSVDSFVAADDIENGYLRTIPLWLFGFTY